jgi:hypothetical protein
VYHLLLFSGNQPTKTGTSLCHKRMDAHAVSRADEPMARVPKIARGNIFLHAAFTAVPFFFTYLPLPTPVYCEEYANVTVQRLHINYCCY